MELLAAGLYLDKKMTFFIAAGAVTYVFLSHFIFLITHGAASFFKLAFYSIYASSVFLTAALPYFTNLNQRQEQDLKSILSERRRLSHEIHDGVDESPYNIHQWNYHTHQRAAE